MFFNLFKKKERVLGNMVVFVNTVRFEGFGGNTIVPKGAICYNYGRPAPSWKYDDSFIELKLLKPIKNGILVTDRLVMKKNSKNIDTWEGIIENE